MGRATGMALTLFIYNFKCQSVGQWLLSLSAMKKLLRRNFAFLSVLFGAVPAVMAQGTAETVTVTEPGTLSEIVNNLPSTRIESLVVKGALNAADIAYLRNGIGKLIKTEALDISEVTLVPGEDSYGSLLVASSDVGFGTTTQHYFISDEYHVETDWESTGLGGTKVNQYVYCNDLSGAFAGCTNYKSVKLPVGLTGIGAYMFFDNAAVEEVDVPATVTAVGEKAFRGTGSLKGIALPEAVDKIPARTFDGSGLGWVTFSEHVDTIGEAAFRGCKLEHVDLSDVRYVGAEAFSGNLLQGELNIENLDTIRDYSFYNNKAAGLLDIKFSDKLKVIGNNAFAYCNINELHLPEGLERIGSSAFYRCEKLEMVEIPKSLLVISGDAFELTPWADNLAAENGVVYIGSIAYKYDAETDTGLPTFSFKEGTTSISGGSFFPWQWYDDRSLNITEIELPSTMQYVGEDVFGGLSNLEEINLPEGLKEIGGRAFVGCEKLWIDKLPETLEFIGESAFEGCSSIPEVTLPENLTRIGDKAFKNCTGIYKVTINSRNLSVLTEGAGWSSSVFLKCQGIDKLVVGSKVRILPNLGFESLKKLDFEDIENSELQVIGDGCFDGCKLLCIDKLPKSIRRIGRRAFSRLMINDLVFSDIEYIGVQAFGWCSGIKKVVFPEKAITISTGAFIECLDLEEVIIEGNIDFELEEGWTKPGIFEDCPVLSKVIIGRHAGYIPMRTFIGCEALSEVVFEERPLDTDAALTIGEAAFVRCNLDGELSFPNGLDAIGEDAFNNNNISAIELPSTCRELGDECFAYNQLTSIHLNDGLVNIGTWAFGCNMDLKSIDIPATCETIGEGILYGCNSLEEINMYPVTPPAINGEISDVRTLVINVPEESLDAYRSIPSLAGYDIRPMDIEAESVVLDRGEVILAVGESVTLTATVLPENTTDKTVAWSTSDASVAIVDNNGTVMAVALGEAAITAECGAASVVCKVSVTENGGLTNTVSDTMSIVSDGGTIRISGVPSNERVRVLRVDGTMVYDGTDRVIYGLAPGYYIVVVGTVKSKLAVN